MKQHRYFVYIITNVLRTVLYTGITNDLRARLVEHFNGKSKFTGDYNVHYLLYFEVNKYVLNAIRREKEIKGWTRAKKFALIATQNPDLDFLNTKFFPEWPPKDTTPLR